jgi:hypothetical protein
MGYNVTWISYSTDVSELLAAFIFKVIQQYVLKHWYICTNLHRIISQQTDSFMKDLCLNNTSCCLLIEVGNDICRATVE